MTTLSTTVFSEYEVLAMRFVFTDGDVGVIKCTGSVEEATEVRNLTKKCRGVVVKDVTLMTGHGTLSISAHVPTAIYNKMYALDQSELADGVVGMKRDARPPHFAVTCDIYDEDGVEKYRAYPYCVVSGGPARKTENGADEVAEVEFEVAFAPDDNGYGFYEALVDDLDDDVKEAWLESFDPSLMFA